MTGGEVAGALGGGVEGAGGGGWYEMVLVGHLHIMLVLVVGEVGGGYRDG